MRKELFAVLAIATTLSLSACGGGGGGGGNTTQAVPPGNNGSDSTDKPRTLAEAFKEIGSHFSAQASMNYNRFDVIGDGRMLVGYSPDRSATELVMVDYTDTDNIVYTKLGKGDHHRGVIAEDFNNDGELEIYTYSHGYEYVLSGGLGVETAKSGKNFLITPDNQVELISDTYTHGACTGDFNGDSFIDIVDVNVYHGNNPLVRYGDGNNNFSDARDMPVGFLELNEAFTSCASHDVNSDGYDDIIFGLEGGPNHVIVYGGVDSLSFSSRTSLVSYGPEGQVYTLTDRGPVTTQMFTTGDYLVTFVTDYDTGTMIELFKVENDSYTHVETKKVDTDLLDIKVDGNVAVATNKWRSIGDIAGYYSRAVVHVTVDDGSLLVQTKRREQ